MTRYDYDDLGWDEDHDYPQPADRDPAYECRACWWTGDEPPVGPEHYLICPDCGADVDDYDPDETTRERLEANIAACQRWASLTTEERVAAVTGGRRG